MPWLCQILQIKTVSTVILALPVFWVLKQIFLQINWSDSEIFERYKGNVFFAGHHFWVRKPLGLMVVHRRSNNVVVTYFGATTGFDGFLWLLNICQMMWRSHYFMVLPLFKSTVIIPLSWRINTQGNNQFTNLNVVALLVKY